MWPWKDKYYRCLAVGRTVRLWLKQVLSITVDLSSAKLTTFGLRNATMCILRSQSSGVGPFFASIWKSEHNVVQRSGPSNDRIFIKTCRNVEENFLVSLSVAGDSFVFRRKVNPGQCWLLSLYTISTPHRILCVSAFIRSSGKSFKYKIFMGHPFVRKPKCSLSSLTVIPLGWISRTGPGEIEVALVGQRETKALQTDSSSNEYFCCSSSPSTLSSSCWT